VRLTIDLSVQPALFTVAISCIALGLLFAVAGPPLALPAALDGAWCVGAIPGAWYDWHEYTLRVALVPVGGLLLLLARAIGPVNGGKA